MQVIKPRPAHFLPLPGGDRSASTRPFGLDHAGHVAPALSALADQQQVAVADDAGEVGDDHLATAIATPDIGKQTLAGFGRDGLPKAPGLWGEVGD